MIAAENNIMKDASANDNSRFWVFFAVLSLLTALSYLIYGAIHSHPGYDYYFHLTRFNALTTALSEGNYPVYIDYSAALNYGYLSKFFYSDVVLLPFAFLGLITGASTAYEVMLVTMTLLCGTFMYKTINTIYKNAFAAFIGSILYTFSVYRLFDVYNRGALGEVFAFTFIPLVFLGFYHIIKGDYKKWYIIAIGFSFLIFSHVISTVLTFITVVVLLVIYYKSLIKEPRRVLFLVLAGVIIILITSSYILPMFEQMQSNTFRYESNDWTLPSRAKLPLEYVLWAVACGFVYPKGITIVGIGVLLSVVIFFRFFIKEKSTLLKSVDIGVLIGLFYMVASSSLFPWGRFPFSLLSFIQYPSRLFLLVTFFFAIAGGYYLSRIFVKNKARLIVASVVIVCVIGTFIAQDADYKYMHENHIAKTNSSPNAGNFFYLNGAEYVPDKVSSGYSIEERGDSVAVIGGNIRIDDFYREKSMLYFDVTATEQGLLELPLFYYKGYSAELSGKELFVTQSSNGLAQILVEESGAVKVFYKGTSLQYISWYISLLSIVLLSAYIFIQYRKRKSKA